MPRMAEPYLRGCQNRQRTSGASGCSGPPERRSVILVRSGGGPRHRQAAVAGSGAARTLGRTLDMADERGRIFIDAAAYADLDRWHATATEMRAEGPLHRVELADRDPFWAVLGLPEIMEIEKNSDVFTNAPDPVMNPKGRMTAEREPSPVNTLIQMDG